MRCNDAERAEAVALAADVGPAEAARRLGLNANTLRSWMSRAGRVPAAEAVAQTATATAARLASLAGRKTVLAEGLMDDIERLRRDLLQVTVEERVLEGDKDSSKVRRTTTMTERNTVITTVAKAIEAVQLLTGEATQRIEQLGAGDGTPAPQRAKAEGTVLELVRGSAA